MYGNNIYYQEALGKDIIQITNTGEEQNIFNGIPDWVYEGKLTARQRKEIEEITGIVNVVCLLKKSMTMYNIALKNQEDIQPSYNILTEKIQ